MTSSPIKGSQIERRTNLSKELLTGELYHKVRDLNGHVNAIFKEGAAGKDFKLSLLKFFSKMKEQNVDLDFLKMADVDTIYKGNGGKNDIKK